MSLSPHPNIQTSSPVHLVSIHFLPAALLPDINCLKPEADLATPSFAGIQNVSIFRNRRTQDSIFASTLWQLGCHLPITPPDFFLLNPKQQLQSSVLWYVGKTLPPQLLQGFSCHLVQEFLVFIVLQGRHRVSTPSTPPFMSQLTDKCTFHR
jgi:hypothetical protein